MIHGVSVALGAGRPGSCFSSISSLQDGCHLSGTWFPYLKIDRMRTVALNQRLNHNCLGSFFFFNLHMPRPCPWR